MKVVRYPLKGWIQQNLHLVPCSRIGSDGQRRTISSSSGSWLHCHHACRATQPYWDSRTMRHLDPGQSEGREGEREGGERRRERGREREPATFINCSPNSNWGRYTHPHMPHFLFSMQTTCIHSTKNIQFLLISRLATCSYSSSLSIRWLTDHASQQHPHPKQSWVSGKSQMYRE